MSTAPDTSLAARLAAIDAAHAAGTITEHSAQTMRDWLTQPRYAEFAGELATRIDRAAAEPAVWKELDDVYWTVIPFGTGGRRGRMYPVGSNAINDRTIGESAQGLADYVRSVMPAGQEPSCAIAYDTRHRSEHFAKLCAEVLLAAGFRIFFLRGFRSTPELSYAVRHTQSTCGIMVTASHNPPSDNAVKVYWAGGVQVLPPHDKGIIDRVMRCDAVYRESFDAGVAAAPLTMASGSEWQTFTGNQIAALLVDWVLSSRKRLGTLSATDHVITTLVTTGLVRRIADAYGATTVDTLQVGFKWIGQAIDQNGPEHFVFGCEESHGYLAGTHVRDKDASVAALLLAELAAALKPQGKTLHEQLDAIFCTHGCHLERQVAITLPGAAGMDRMREIMATLRSKPPAALGGLPVARVRDYGSLTTSTPGAAAVPFAGAKGDLVMFDLADPAAPAASLTVAEVAAGRFPALANCVAARPSGTEPKIKFYLFAAAAPCGQQQLAATKSALTQRLDALERDLRSLAGV